MSATPPSVPLLDLKAQYAPLREEIREAVDALMDSQLFVLGAPVQALEEAVATYTGTAHAIGCASGTDALILALAALDVGPGDRVLTTPFSFFSTASCAYKVGARPAFADIDPRTFNLDPVAVEATLDDSVRALLPVHLFGQCAAMEPLLELGQRRGIPVVEDAAQALGSRCQVAGNWHAAGAAGAIGCYSFFPTKNLGAFGDGGMLVTSDAALAERLRLLRVHGGKQMYHHEYVGWNSRLDALQAVVLRIKLRHLDDWSAGRAANADRYDRWLEESGLIADGHVTTPYRDAGSAHIFNQYTLRVERRDALRQHLNTQGVGHSVYYPVPLHLQACFAELGHRQGQFPEAERACDEVIALPIYPELGQKQQERVVDALLKFYRRRD